MMNNASLLSLVLAACGALVLAGSTSAPASPGDLDPSFGVGGTVTMPTRGWGAAHDLALQPDGKLVVAASFQEYSMVTFGLIRYNVDGSLDPSFGSGGTVTTTVGPGYSIVWALVLQPDGRLVEAGASGNRCALVRYNANGTLDGTFGTGGIVTTSIGWGDCVVTGLVLQPDGKLVTVALAVRNVSGQGLQMFALARYNADGSLDGTFGNGGIVTTTVSSGDSFPSSLVLQPDGKLVAAGGGIGHFALVRYNADGSLDETFGNGGIVMTPTSSMNALQALVLQPDGKLVAAGDSYWQFVGSDIVLLRYNADGSLDETFGVGGKVTTSFGDDTFDYARALVLQPDGRLVAAGYTTDRAFPNVPPSYFDWALVRYNADGSLDGTFGVGGKVTTDSGYQEEARALVLQPDSKLVAGGYGGAATELALARYIGSVCHNGVFEEGEECDDGNTQSGDGCSTTCELEATPTPTETATETPTLTATATATDTATTTATATDTATPAHTPTATPTMTATNTPADTRTDTPTVSPTPAPTPVACPASPAGGCLTSANGLLILKDHADNAKDKFLWKFGKGPALVQGDFGIPTGTTSYALCVYDDGALAMEARVGPNATLWAAVGSKGWQYKDLAGTQDGVTKAKLLGGDAGKSKAQVKGKGVNVSLPAPISATQFLNATTSVQAQLHGSNGACYETAFTPAEVIKNDGGQFKAKF